MTLRPCRAWFRPCRGRWRRPPVKHSKARPRRAGSVGVYCTKGERGRGREWEIEKEKGRREGGRGGKREREREREDDSSRVIAAGRQRSILERPKPVPRAHPLCTSGAGRWQHRPRYYGSSTLHMPTRKAYFNHYSIRACTGYAAGPPTSDITSAGGRGPCP